MIIKLSKQLLESVDDGHLDRFGIDISNIRYHSHLTIDAEDLSDKQIQGLIDIFGRSKVHGYKTVVRNLQQWLDLQKNNDTEKVRMEKVPFFKSLLHKEMEDKERKFVYQWDEKRGVMYCSYIYEIEYKEKQVYREYTIPEHCSFHLSWIEFGEEHHDSFKVEYRDIYRKTLRETMKEKFGIYFEDDILRSQYLSSVEKFEKYVDSVGKQFTATGMGSSDVDNGDQSWWRSSSNINLDKGGNPSNVVIDIFRESDEESRGRSKRDHNADEYYWARRSPMKDGEEMIAHELPIHPNLVIFTLRKQTRLRVHIDQLTEYIYNPALGQDLILPNDAQKLVETLANYKGGSKDIIGNKGGGAIVMCSGIPGTGKTLTSEVYAEVMERPLYSVQCSQLGTNPDELEEALLKIFARAQRWQAILLLDEADVYVHERGDDLHQNAIVGVFLRVLEYYNGVMFMTTNRSDSIDDAVLSRCIAKIEYKAPTPNDLKQIWQVLSDVQGLGLSNEFINKLVDKYPGITGRDVKNILKLAAMISNGKVITMKEIDFAKQFKPTK